VREMRYFQARAALTSGESHHQFINDLTRGFMPFSGIFPEI
jgi:hypothetical protein